MYSQTLKVPLERVGVLIGVKGEVKKKIESRMNVKLNIDSKQGEVEIVGKDSLKVFETRPIVQAIARGFTPDEAFELFNENNVLEIINVTEFSGKSKKKKIRLSGRVIGEHGKARKNIEYLTGTKVVLYGKTVGIIGEPERVSLARRAIAMLLEGAPHGPVYRMLEKKQHELHIREIEHELG